MSDEKLLERITTELDAGIERLDGTTRARLTQARYRALAVRRQPRWIWPAVGGAVAVSLLTVIIWQGHRTAEQESMAAVDFELLSEGDSIELYEEMEFIEWLEESEQRDVV